jgi:hypothetical protein
VILADTDLFHLRINALVFLFAFMLNSLFFSTNEALQTNQKNKQEMLLPTKCTSRISETVQKPSTEKITEFSSVSFEFRVARVIAASKGGFKGGAKGAMAPPKMLKVTVRQVYDEACLPP